MSDEANIYPPLTKEEIKTVVDNSVNSDKLDELLDVNFVGLDRPCSVSLGIDCGDQLDSTRIELISEILKSYGIDAVDRSSPEALDPSKYILDKSGISLPFMEPREALKATAELNDIFISHGFKVTGYASPRTQESLCPSTKYDGKIINVSGELDDNPQAKAMLEKRGISAEDFIQQQLEEATKLPAIDVNDVDNTALSSDVGIKYLYRGASLGDNPYAVVAAKRSKDIVYSSPKMLTAAGYSAGLEAGFAEVNTPDGKTIKYGNIYRYSATEDLNLWADFGYERGYGHVINKGYETPVFAHKNKVNGIFFVVADGENTRVVQITDDNGKYISKEWEDFMMLHAPRMRAGTELDKQRNDNQIKMLAEGKLSSWNVHPHGKTLDLSKYNDIDLSGVDLSQFEDLKLSPFLRDITGTNFPEGTSWLDFCDLKLVKDKWRLPKGIKNLEDIKFPETLKQLDLSRCDDIDLSVADLPRIEDLTLPGSITSLKRIRFPETLKRLDLSECYGINLSGADLSQVEDLKLPIEVNSLEKTKLPKNVNFSNCYINNLDFSKADFSCVEHVKLPDTIKSSSEQLKYLLTCSHLKSLDISSCLGGLDVKGMDFSKIEEVMFPDKVKNLGGAKLPKRLNFSACRSCMDMSGIDFSQCDVVKLGVTSINADFSQFAGELKLPETGKLELGNVKLPSNLKSLDLSQNQTKMLHIDLNGIEELKLPEKFAKTNDFMTEYDLESSGGNYAIISPDCKLDNLKKLDVSLCKNADLRDWNLDKIEELKLPKNFDVSKLPEGIMERNPAVARAVKISQGEITETLEQTVVKEKVSVEQEVRAGATPPPIEKQLQQEAKTEKTLRKVENPAAEKIQQLRGVENSGAQAVAEAGEKVAEKAAVRAGAEAVKSSGGIVSAIAKADNAVNQAIDKTIDKGSELLNNNAVGRAYEKAAEKVADTKVVKAVEKTTAKVAEKAANTTVGKAVVKAAAKTAGSAVGKSVIKKIPLVSAAAGCYFAWDRIKDGDWKGACGEVASGVAGCFPGLGTAASAAIDVGLAAKDIKSAVAESKGTGEAEQPKETEAAGAPSGNQTEEDKKKAKEIILQKRGQLLPEARAQVQQTQQNNNYLLQQKAAQQGRG